MLLWMLRRRHTALLAGCAQEAEAEAAGRAAEAAAEEAAVVAAERRRMLAEAAHLRDFMPKGVVQSMEELSLLDRQARQAGQQQVQAKAS